MIYQPPPKQLPLLGGVADAYKTAHNGKYLRRQRQERRYAAYEALVARIKGELTQRNMFLAATATSSLSLRWCRFQDKGAALGYGSVMLEGTLAKGCEIDVAKSISIRRNIADPSVLLREEVSFGRRRANMSFETIERKELHRVRRRFQELQMTTHGGIIDELLASWTYPTEEQLGLAALSVFEVEKFEP